MVETLEPYVDINRRDMVVSRVVEAKMNGEGIFALNQDNVEARVLDTLSEHEQKSKIKGFAENAIVAITPSLKLTDTTEILYRLADKELIARYEWYFMPSEIDRLIANGAEGLVFAASDLLIQPSANNRGVYAWHHNARLIHSKYQDRFSNFLKWCGNDARIAAATMKGPRTKTRTLKSLDEEGNRRKKVWKGFQGFGDKLAKFALHMIYQTGSVDLEGITELGPWVDRWGGEILTNCGVARFDTVINRLELQEKILAPSLAEFTTQTKIPPFFVSDALYRVGHFYCSNRDHDNCPVRNLCAKQSYISKEYYGKGRYWPISPEDLPQELEVVEITPDHWEIPLSEILQSPPELVVA